MAGRRRAGASRPLDRRPRPGAELRVQRPDECGRLPRRHEPRPQLPRAPRDREPRVAGRGGGGRATHAARRGRCRQRRARAGDARDLAAEPGAPARADGRKIAGCDLYVGGRLRDRTALRLVPRPRRRCRRRLARHRRDRGHAPRALAGVARAADQRVRRVQPGQPLVEPLSAARPLRADPTAFRGAERLARALAPPDRPDHGRRALCRQDRRRRPRVERGRLLAPVSCDRRRGSHRGGAGGGITPAVGRRDREMNRLAAALAAACFLGVPAAAAGGPLTVSIDRAHVSTRLGHSFVFRSTIVNHGRTAAAGRIAHLNVLSLRPGVYVDPEDWSSHRTRYLTPIPPRGSTTLRWQVKAVNAGSIGVYVAVLPASGTPVRPPTGPLLEVAIADHKSLNTGGTAPLALGVPLVLVALLVVVRLRRRAR